MATAFFLTVIVPLVGFVLWYNFKQGYQEKDINEGESELTCKPPASNKTKGDDFEGYIVELFNQTSGRFKLLEWQGDKKAANGTYALSTHNPDLLLAFINDNKEHRFAIECKWRQSFQNGEIFWARDYQIRNYIEYQKKNQVPVWVAIGVGGEPAHPENLYVTRLDNIVRYPKVFESYLKQYKRNPSHRFFYNPQDRQLV